MAIREIQVKSILQRSGIPGADYVINPYTGCVHGCVYCYARFMKRFTGHTDAWGAFLDVKINAPELLERQLSHRKTPLEGTIFLSSVTDPYLPAERKYQLTRRVLEVLLNHQAAISILTKSDLVTRDIDLLKQFRRCSVGLSMMTVDDAAAQAFEHHAAPPSRRIHALQTLHANGIRTYAFLSPYLPTISGIDLLFERLSGAVDEVGIEALNPRGGGMDGVKDALNAYAPHSTEQCFRLVRDDQYWDALEFHARQLAARANIAFMGLFRHGRQKT